MPDPLELLYIDADGLGDGELARRAWALCRPQAVAIGRQTSGDPVESLHISFRAVCTALAMPLLCPRPACRRALGCCSPHRRGDAPWCWATIVRKDHELHAAFVRCIREEAARLGNVDDR